MRFGQWLLLNEVPHKTLRVPIEYEGNFIMIIDLKVEDWRIDEEDEETKLIQRRLMMALPPPPPYYGFIPDSGGRYLYYDGNEEYRFELTRTEPSRGINLDELNIGGSWWDYVEGVDQDNNMVKKPSPPIPSRIPQRVRTQ